MADYGVSDLAAVLRTLGYAACAAVYLYRVWTPTQWRVVHLATALQYAAGIVVALITIVEPVSNNCFRLYLLTPLVVFAAITGIYQTLRDIRR